MKYIVSISGGLGSAEALKRAIEKYGKENVIAIFADVKGDGYHNWLGMPVISRLLHERFGGESRDTYRFIWQLAYHFDIDIIRLESYRSIWDVFANSKSLRMYTGGAFFCKASEILKRKAIALYIKDNVRGAYKIILGMGWDEEHRIKRANHYWQKVQGLDTEVITLNAEPPVATNEQTALWCKQNEIEVPSAYHSGMANNNCGGGCVQAGQGHFANLFRVRHEVYMYWAWMEKMVTRYIGHDYTILKDSRGGTTRRLSLYDFVKRIEVGDYRALDFGACGCFTNLGQLQSVVAIQLEVPTNQLQLLTA